MTDMDPDKCCDSACVPCERDPADSEPIDLCNYVGGAFVCHSNDEWMNVLEPATGYRFGRVPLSSEEDVVAAVAAAPPRAPPDHTSSHPGAINLAFTGIVGEP